MGWLIGPSEGLDRRPRCRPTPVRPHHPLGFTSLFVPSPQCARFASRQPSSSPAAIFVSFPSRDQVAVVLVPPTAAMQNEEGTMVDLYIPRKCSATNRIITAKDHASVQINIGHVDENGLYNGQFTALALSGFVRAQGDADSSLDRLWQKREAEIKQ